MHGHRIGAVGALGGSVLLFLGTYLHPMDADPDDAIAAFAEYAADPLWIASHLVQLAGFALMVGALLCLAHQIDQAGGRLAWSRLAAGGAVASLAVAAALQAVDGIALKVMVDSWAAAPEPQKLAAFHGAFAVRQVEIGLASTLGLLSGATVLMYGFALWHAGIYAAWIAILAWLAGGATLLAGAVMAYAGFSSTAMAFSMPASLLALFWLVAIGIMMWRRAAAMPHAG